MNIENFFIDAAKSYLHSYKEIYLWISAMDEDEYIRTKEKINSQRDLYKCQIDGAKLKVALINCCKYLYKLNDFSNNSSGWYSHKVKENKSQFEKLINEIQHAKKIHKDDESGRTFDINGVEIKNLYSSNYQLDSSMQIEDYENLVIGAVNRDVSNLRTYPVPPVYALITRNFVCGFFSNFFAESLKNSELWIKNFRWESGNELLLQEELKMEKGKFFTSKKSIKDAEDKLNVYQQQTINLWQSLKNLFPNFDADIATLRNFETDFDAIYTYEKMLEVCNAIDANVQLKHFLLEKGSG